MFNDIFQSVDGINNYGLISTLIFFIFFSLVLVHTLSIKKKDLTGFSRMPFDDATRESNDV
jgi:hypothetical protein